LRHWQWFDMAHEPLPDRLADIHNGMIMATMVNIMRAPESAPVAPSDFFVIRERAEPEEPVPEIDRLRAQWRGE
jgi:hypothetical protein